MVARCWGRFDGPMSGQLPATRATIKALPTDHPPSCLSSWLRLMPIGAPLRSPWHRFDIVGEPSIKGERSDAQCVGARFIAPQGQGKAGHIPPVHQQHPILNRTKLKIRAKTFNKYVIILLRYPAREQGNLQQGDTACLYPGITSNEHVKIASTRCLIIQQHHHSNTAVFSDNSLSRRYLI